MPNKEVRIPHEGPSADGARKTIRPRLQPGSHNLHPCHPWHPCWNVLFNPRRNDRIRKGCLVSHILLLAFGVIWATRKVSLMHWGAAHQLQALSWGQTRPARTERRLRPPWNFPAPRLPPCTPPSARDARSACTRSFWVYWSALRRICCPRHSSASLQLWGLTLGLLQPIFSARLIYQYSITSAETALANCFNAKAMPCVPQGSICAIAVRSPREVLLGVCVVHLTYIDITTYLSTTRSIN